MIKIVKTALGFEREPLLLPFGFKGKYVNEIWNLSVAIQSGSGEKGIGLGVQSVLWSDSQVFSSFSPSGGNCIMLLMTEYALSLLKDREFSDPIALLDEIFPQVYQYGQKISGLNDMRKTFALNALVPVDMALWKLYVGEHKIKSFDDMLPPSANQALNNRQNLLASVPLITYGIDTAAITGLVENGSFILKIKLGNDPDRDNDLEKMLAWDKERITQIHTALKSSDTPYTENGRIAYYLDANGRYDCKDRLLRLIDHADKINALEQIVLFEEPFSEDIQVDVSDIPVRIAADESVHSSQDADRLIDMGYTAIALKPIAKTLSMSLKILEKAYKKNVPCFCADLTVNPLMVEWNKNVAARLDTLPGIKTGVLEANGHQYYANWENMKTYHPMGQSGWVDSRNGFFILDDNFYITNGGIFENAPHYENIAYGKNESNV